MTLHEAETAFDSAVNQHGHDSREAIAARTIVADLLGKARTPKVDKLAAPTYDRFPNAVIRDKRVTPQLLALLGFRNSLASDRVAFGLNQKALLAKPIVSKGLGGTAFRTALALGKRLGYIVERKQDGRPCKPGGFRYATEKLALPTFANDARESITIPKSLFDGTRTTKTFALLLYIQAGTGRGPSVYMGELIDRFGWGERTINAALDPLIKAGQVTRNRERAANGTFCGVKFTVGPVSKEQPSTQQKTVSVLPDSVKTDSTRKFPTSRKFPSHVKTLRGNADKSATPPSAPQETGDLDCWTIAFSNPKLLGWLPPGAPDIDPVDVEPIEAVHTEEELRGFITDATGGRLETILTGEAGLFAVRWLAATVAQAENLKPAAAISRVLEAIDDRVGSRADAYLGSLALVGKGFLWRSEARPDDVATAIATLRKSVGAHAIAERTWHDKRGFDRLVKRYGLDLVTSTVSGWLVRAVIDAPMDDDEGCAWNRPEGLGVCAGTVYAWKYFEPILREEEERERAERAKVTPDGSGGGKRR